MQNDGKRRDHFQALTDQIIEHLDRGVVPWQRPWDETKCSGPQAPFNPASGTVYKGTNFLSLAMDPRTFLTGDPRFCTFKNCVDNDWHVRKGEHGIPLIYYEPRSKQEEEAADDGRPGMRFLLKGFTVFHASQIDGIPPYDPPTAGPLPPWEKPPEVVAILDKSGVPIREVGEKAYYSPATDHIGLPPLIAFAGAPQWAATALHELGHATGHKSRLDRDLTGAFGSQKYALEELRVELSSLFVCSTLGLPLDTQNHAAYLGHWSAKLREDKRGIVHAARDAQKIADFVLALRPDAPEIIPDNMADLADVVHARPLLSPAVPAP